MIRNNYKGKYLKYKKKYTNLLKTSKIYSHTGTGFFDPTIIDLSNEDKKNFDLMKNKNILDYIRKICHYFKYTVFSFNEYKINNIIELLGIKYQFFQKVEDIVKRKKNKSLKEKDYIVRKVALKLVIFDKYFDKRFLIDDILVNLKDLYHNELYYILGPLKNRPLTKLKLIFSAIKNASSSDTYNNYMKNQIQCDRLVWMRKSLRNLEQLNLVCDNISNENMNQGPDAPDAQDELDKPVESD